MRPFDPRAWPIRWRLTALNVGVLATTLLVLGGVFLLQLDGALIGITTDYLRDQARPAVQFLYGPRSGLASERERFGPPFSREREGPGAGLLPERERPGPSLPPDRERGAPFSLPRVAGGMVRTLSGPDTGVFVFDADRALVAASEVDEDVEAWPQPTTEQLRAALAGAESASVVGQQARRTLVLLLPLRGPDGSVVGVLALARSLELTDQLQARLQLILALGTLIALLLAGGLSLRATRGALRPLDHVIRAARRFGAGRLDERLRLERRDEIGELAHAFDAMLDRLASVLEAQRRFVADAAHELRTPLTALGGMVEMLQMGADRGDPSTVRRMLDTMDREIGRLGRLVADLLTLSRLDAEQQPLALAPVELAPLVAEVAHQTELLAQGHKVQLRIEASPTVLGDADRLRQVLLNLADNALKFTPPGGRLELRLDQAGGHARVAVADTGSGIAPEVLPRVTDRFVRGDASRARATGGAGLGLAIARGIVEAHGGTLEIDSEVGRGTTVTINLPLAAPAESPRGASLAAAGAARPATSSGRPGR